jgi:hypothetical protein
MKTDTIGVRPMEKHSAIGCGIVVFHRRLHSDGLKRKDMTELTRQCLSLSRVRRERLVKLLQASLEKPMIESIEDRFKMLLEVATEVVGIGIMTKHKDHNLVMGRRMITYQMRNDGLSFAEIGRFLKRDHASIRGSYLNMLNVFEYPKMYELEMSYWTLFQQKLKEKEDDKARTI